jgi:GNAT superfamily N-acetyltransferase
MNAGELQIREITPTDLAAVVELIARCDETYLDWAPPGWSPPDLDWYRDAWEARLASGEVWARGAFDRDGDLAGVVAVRPDMDRDERPRPGVGQVFAVFVDPPRWRQGLGANLLGLAEEELRRRGYAASALWTPAGGPAERFYRRQGWHLQRGREFFDRLGLDMVRYEKGLTPGG